MPRQLSLVAVDQMPEKENRLKDNSVYSIQGTTDFVIKKMSYHAHISYSFFQRIFIIEYFCFLSAVVCNQVQDRKGIDSTNEVSFLCTK
jgi:hypothetical protein